jgi:DNA glycosylase AlkZ-like
VLCFGTNRGTESTFVRPDQWLDEDWNKSQWSRATWESSQFRDKDRNREALKYVYLAYLRAYGPARHRDFAQWFNLPNAVAREIEAELRPELTEIRLDGYRGYLRQSSATIDPEPPPPTVNLLPHFDCYLRGCHPREQLVGPWAKRAAGGTGNVPVLLVDGVVGGIWKRQERRGRLEITVEPFVTLAAEHLEQLEAAVARIGAFDELPCDFALGTVDVRPHL